MNRWYRKTVVKAAAFILAVLSGAGLVMNLAVVVALAGTVNPSEIMEITRESYEESKDFNQTVGILMRDIMYKESLENLFETEGVYNPGKLVDVMEYADKQTITGDNVSGVTYTLEELEKWSEDYNEGEGENYDGNGVIVCSMPDGKYYYYYTSDFLTLVENGQLQIQFQNSEQDLSQFLYELENGQLTSSGYYEFRIYDEAGNLLYTDCWNFGRSLKEKYPPQGASNLLEVVNATPQLNGKLSIIYDDLGTTLSILLEHIANYRGGWVDLEEGNTNLTYIYIDEDTKKVATNKSEYESYTDAEKNIAKMTSGDSVKYMIVYPKLKDFKTNMNIFPSGEWDAVRSYETGRKFNRILALAVDTEYPVKDQFYEGHQSYEHNIPLLKNCLIASLVLAVLFILAGVWCTLTAGRRCEDEDVHLTSFDRWKTEPAAVVVAVVLLCGTLAASSVGARLGLMGDIGSMSESYVDNYSGAYASDTYYSLLFSQTLSLVDMMGVFVYGVFLFGCLFAGYVSLIKRIKAKTLWENSVLLALLRFGSMVVRERSTTAKALVFVAGLLLIQLLMLLMDNVVVLLLVLLADGVVIYVILSNAISKSRIRKGVEEVAAGNMEYRISLEGLTGSNRILADKINDIGTGLNKAVDEAMRNERLKTDLITNVSHDIKTPLTSIINYVDILKRSNMEDPAVQGYLDILEEKAQRLKTLTEDVVEASKVSSGNITLECMDVNFSEMVQQTRGEFEEKFQVRNLTVVLNLPEEPAVIHVDGRRMWRVLENIFGNAAKYAMPGTRVYADLRLEADTVDFSLKNVSEQQLNISADELTERFIRGDISRSTEGSGLGLSIAKSLTIMQGGEFELYLDGDLFRVNIRFPRVIRQENEE